MAVRQYIGARYVPVFFTNELGGTDWRANTQYEPLTIVTYNGNSYTSKQMVPAGIGNPSAYPEYWASTGVFNSQVEEYRQEVEELSKTVSTGLSGRKFILVGDSWAAGLTYNSNTASRGPSFYDVLINSLGLVENNTYYRTNQDGCGFVDNDPHTFLELLQAVNVADPAEITDIYVTGGLNDRPYTATQIENAISAFVTYAKSNYPNAKVSIGCTGIGTGVFADMGKVIGAYKNCVKYGAAYMDGIESYIFGRTIRYDNIHGTTEGYATIGEGLINYTLTGACGTYTEAKQYTVAAPSGVTLLNLDKVNELISNGRILLASTTHWFRITFASEPAHLASHKIGTLSEYSPIKSGVLVRGNCVARGTTSGNLYPAEILIEGADISISIVNASALGDTTFIINQLQIDCPVELSAG